MTTTPPEVPRGSITEQALGLFFTRFKTWAADVLKDLRTLAAAVADEEITRVSGDFAITNEKVVEYVGTVDAEITLPPAADPLNPGRCRRVTILNNSFKIVRILSKGDDAIDGYIPSVLPIRLSGTTSCEYVSNGTYLWTGSRGRMIWLNGLRRIILGSNATVTAADDAISLGTRVNGAHDDAITLGTDAASDAAHKLRIFLNSAVKMELVDAPASGETGLFLICDVGGGLVMKKVTLAASVGGQRALQVAG